MTKLEELRVAYGSATPGEWVTGKGGTAYYPLQIRCVSSDWDSLIAAFHSWDAQKESNANFIALAHNMMPTLLEAVDLLETLRYSMSQYDDGEWFLHEGGEDVVGKVDEFLEKLFELFR